MASEFADEAIDSTPPVVVQPASDQTGTTARVIKSDAARSRIAPAYREARLLKGAVLAATETLAHAEQARRAAELDAAQAVAEARAECDAIRNTARGEALAEVEGKFTAILTALEGQLARQQELFAVAVQLAGFKIARSLIGAELTLNPQRVIEIVERLVRQSRKRQLELHLHPQDAELIENHLPRLKRALPGVEDLSVVADADMPRFAVKLRTENGDYHRNLNAELNSLAVHLLGESAEGL